LPGSLSTLLLYIRIYEKQGIPIPVSLSYSAIQQAGRLVPGAHGVGGRGRSGTALSMGEWVVERREQETGPAGKL